MTLRQGPADIRRLPHRHRPWTPSRPSTGLFLSAGTHTANSALFSHRRYAAIFARLRALTPHPTNAIAGTKLALRDYVASQSGARDLISTLWNILDCELDATASIVNLIVDFIEEEEKKSDLLAAWSGFKVERRRERPDFMPTSIGTDYAGIADGRTLNAATALRAASGHAQRAVWDRVAQAAERGASFPPLRTPPQQRQPPAMAQHRTPQSAPTGPTPGFRKKSARNTAWSASAAGVNAGGGGGSGGDGSGSNVSVSQGGARPPAAPPPAPALTNAAFPTLPSSAAARARPVISARTSQLHHVMGSAPPATSAWAPGRPAQDEAAGSREADEGTAPAEATAGGKKKGKAKQKKQTLFMLSYPSTGRQS
jgi:hypothetical protein